MYLVPRLRTSEDLFSGLDAQIDADLLSYGSGLAAARQSFRSTTAFAPDGVGVRNSIIPPALHTTTNNVPDNYQPVESAWYIPGPTALIDVYTPAPNTTGTLVVDDPNHVMAASDTPGDNDWFKVTLTAGQTYEFGQYARAGGVPGVEGNGIALADAYLEIRDSAGVLLAIADGGGPNTPSGLDALMTFQAPTSGDYYLNATSYDNTGDGIGDFAGDYEIFARTATGTTYTTQYDISSPLHSIDWGGVLVNREHVSVRNPDGMEGPRPTGQPAADPSTVEGNALGFPGKNVIYLYFAGEGDLYANADSTIPAQVTAQNPYQYEIQAMLTAAAEFSKVADVVFVSNYTLNAATGLYERNPNIEYKPGALGPEAGVQYATGVDDDFDADFFYWSYPGTPGPGISLLGSMNPPDNGDEGTAQFNSADERWNAQMLQPGGFSFVTLIHEFGHGMGLAHPHDTGGGSSIMQGVEPGPVLGDDGGAGAFDLNQGVHTMMSYNDGWEKSPYGQPETTNEGYGWLGSLMALDIAVIQDKYGVNEDWATGNDSYVLKDVNEWGVYIDSATGQPAVHDATNAGTSRDGYYEGESTYYSSIWDAGGIDRIDYVGTRDTTIDLRAATLKYEIGGGGRVSFATGIYGGFTIANGVTIENASSGSGNDTLNGNDVANVLEGGAGNDMLSGFGGNDTLIGGLGNDVLDGGTGIDVLQGGDGLDSLRISAASAGSSFDGGAGNDTLDVTGTVTPTGSLTGFEAINLQPGANLVLTGSQFASAFVFNSLVSGAGTITVNMDANVLTIGSAFTVAGGAVVSFIANGTAGDDYVKAIGYASGTLLGGTGQDYLRGGQLADVIDGGADRDKITGFGGADTLTGGAGDDQFRYVLTADSTTGAGADHIVDFAAGTDVLDFRNLDADQGTDGVQHPALTLIGGAAFSGTGGAEIRYGVSGAHLLVEVDVDGDGDADMNIWLDNAGSQTLTSTDFLL